MKRNLIIKYFFLVLVLISSNILALPHNKEIKDSTEILLIHKYGILGFKYLRVEINLDSAEYYLKKAIDLQYKTQNYELDDRVATNYMNLASFYRTVYNNTEALRYTNEAEKILNDYDPNHIFFGRLYHNKGNIFKVMGDLYRTKEYYEYALNFLTKNGYQNESDFAFVFSHYIDLLFELEEYDLAEEKLQEIDINNLRIDPIVEFRILTTNANSYAQLGRYNLANEFFQQAYEKIIKDLEISSYQRDVLNYYYNIIDFYRIYEEYDKALEECENAYSYIESLGQYSAKSKIIYQSDITLRFASINLNMGKNERALRIVNQGIESLVNFLKDLSEGDPNENIRRELATPLPDLYILKSRIMLERYNHSFEDDKLLASYESYTKAIETLNHLRLSMSNEDSKIYETSQVLEVYNEAIMVANLIYEKTGNHEYLEQSFEFAETSKSFALYSEIKDIEAMQFSDLPEEIRQKESRLLGEIQAYEKLIYDEQISENPDLEQIESFKSSLFLLKDDYDDLEHEIELNNTQYYDLKYKPHFVSLVQIQNDLPYKDALIEYVLSDTLLITYVVDRKGINVFSQTVGSEFADECLEFYMLMRHQNFSSNVHDTYKRYVNLGRKLYGILIEPCLEYTDRKNLTIVPDGAITYIPFESLVMEDTETEYINYMTLPYMIKEFSVGYSHSSTLLFSERLKSKSPQNKVLAFAPIYSNPVYEIDSVLMRQVDPESEYMAPLVGTLIEVQSIDETVPADVFINEQATEANFKKNASDYNVLHLAMHTIMKDDDPLYSLLAFSDVEEDTVEDNRLYAYEIYNLKLNAEMAVLSACNSGTGKMQKGEGMMSLARGFIYAGCPSIVMTLWQVTDKSSSELMTSFYRYLKKGKSKQEAMRLAKIDYLEQSDDLTSNPYFWSGFVVLGDSHPIYKKSGFAYWMIVITVFVGMMIYMQFMRSRASRKAAA
jgi:CHAT domain-containing protein/tetratricopeptide (TPR) repeat protein